MSRVSASFARFLQKKNHNCFSDASDGKQSISVPNSECDPPCITVTTWYDYDPPGITVPTWYNYDPDRS